MLRKIDDAADWKTLLKELEGHLVLKAAVASAAEKTLEPLPGFMRLEFSTDKGFYRETINKHMVTLQRALKKCFGKEFRIVLVRPPLLQK